MIKASILIKRGIIQLKISFLNLSDLHIQKKNLVDIRIVLRALFKDIKKQGINIDFILFNGDLINNGSNGLTGDGEYEIAKSEFIYPLLEETGLTINEFFIVPGNHDINRSKISEFIDFNVTSKFNDREKLNKFIDDIEKNDALLLIRRMEDYNIFIKSLYGEGNKYCVKSTPLFSNYIYRKENFNLGIACLNSSWGSVGGASDMSELLIGERQFDIAIQDLNKCDLKIAMFHHPMEWLKEFDRESIKDIIFANFNMVFNGHLHVQNQNKIVHDQYQTLIYRCGSLFENRIFNGYAITTFDAVTKEATLVLRQYYDRRREFDKALNVLEDGQVVYNLDNDKKYSIAKKNMDIKKTIKVQVKDEINSKLISYIAPDTYAPKNINEIYVPPLISNEPEDKGKSDEESFEELEEILDSESNILFIARKEYGKSTLLNYVCDYFMNSFIHEEKLPILLDYRTLPIGKKVYEKAINSFLLDHSVNNINLEEYLEHGNFVLLLDNFNISDKKSLQKLSEFAQKYSKIRFIFTMNEDIMETFHLADIPEFNIDHKIYYIYSYRRNQIRKLVEKWFWQQNKHDQELILDHVIRTQKLVGLTKTPFTFSLLLSIYEKQSNYVPINESALVDKFVKSILEMPIIDEIKYESIDYKIKSDYLSHISVTMNNSGKSSLGDLEFDRETIDYFQSKGLDYVNIDKFKRHFFSKGIFICHDNRVYFRFQCFYELFLAKHIEENEEFRKFVMRSENFLDFKHELIYFSGLNRKSLTLLLFVEEQLENIFKKFDENIEIQEFCDLNINNLFAEKFENKERFSEKMEGSSLSEEEKDQILEQGDKRDKSNRYGNKPVRNSSNEFIDVLELYSNILRNCELIHKDLKKHAIQKSINKYSKLTVFFYKMILDKLDDLKDDNESVDLSEFRHILSIGLPLIIQNLVFLNLGSPKLKSIIEESIDEVSTDLERFMLVCLYGDMRMENYIGMFNSFIKSNKSKLLTEVTVMKLLYYRLFHYKSPLQEKQLLSLLAELTIKKENGNMRNKTYVMNEIDKKSAHKTPKSEIL